MLRLLAATLLAGAIGIGPSGRDKPAGCCTHMLTGLAAALFTLITFAIREKALSGGAVRRRPHSHYGGRRRPASRSWRAAWSSPRGVMFGPHDRRRHVDTGAIGGGVRSRPLCARVRQHRSRDRDSRSRALFREARTGDQPPRDAPQAPPAGSGASRALRPTPALGAHARRPRRGRAGVPAAVSGATTRILPRSAAKAANSSSARSRSGMRSR